MLLQTASKSLAFAKIGIFGFQGSGKSYTAWLIALGISKLIQKNKIAWFDTETGSDFFIDWAKKEGIEFYQVKRRAFVDLMQTIKECEQEGIGVLIEDSITHVWRDLCDSYDRKLKRKGRLQFQDWAIIKTEWKTYTDLFINSKVHIIAAGRAGFEYDYDFNPDGTKDLIKTGTKLKAEGEFAFEPHLVVEMERVTPGQEELRAAKQIKDPVKRKEKKQAIAPQIGSGWIHRAHVLKDRTDTIDGRSFDDPIFENFAPHFSKLNIGGQHVGIEETDSSSLFNFEEKPQWKFEAEQKDIAKAEIKTIIDKYFPSSSAKERRAKIILKEHVFGIRSDEGLEPLDLQTLKIGQEYLDWLLKDPDVVNHLLNSEGLVVQAILKGKKSEWEVYNSNQA